MGRLQGHQGEVSVSAKKPRAPKGFVIAKGGRIRVGDRIGLRGYGPRWWWRPIERGDPALGMRIASIFSVRGCCPTCCPVARKAHARGKKR